MLLLSHTGKSSAIQYAAQDPLENLDFTDAIISKTTSSGLVKLLANKRKGMILSPEVFDIINKLLKSDEDNATGDVQLLCKLFSGERCSYHFSTEETRVIPPNTPFCLLGSTQLVNAAKLIARMDQGHGLVDRILLATPLAFRPTLTCYGRDGTIASRSINRENNIEALVIFKKIQFAQGAPNRYEHYSGAKKNERQWKK